MKLLDRIALVTGGSRGIGRATCIAMARQGAHVVVNYHENQAAAEEVQKEIERQGRQAMVYRADVSKLTIVQAMFRSVIERFGRVDILVNNAGGGLGYNKPIQEISEEDWDRLVDFNLKGVFNCCREASRFMIKQEGGKIINISSQMARRGMSRSSLPYVAAKAGVFGITRNLARQLAPYHITVNTVAPGSIETERHLAEKTPEQRNALIKEIPLGRTGTPEEVAAAVVFLASDDANFITGAILDINGGTYLP